MNKKAIIRKEMIIGKFRSKLTYMFNSADLEDVENIIDFYEQKLNQLETNRDEAIRYIKAYMPSFQNYIASDTEFNAKEVVSILERGKE